MLTFTRSFRVRSYECDAYGDVNNANYLRYMQETAFDASADRGYDLAAYAVLGRLFLVRESDVEYLMPLRYGDAFNVTTWVADFRRVRSRRGYEFHHAATGALVARGTTDWVFVDSRTFRPATVPGALVTAFFPDGAPPAEPRPPFPEPPRPPPNVFTTRHRVAWGEIDSAGHVNNAAYLSYADDAGVQVGAAFGWTMARMISAGFGIVARRIRIEYSQSALLDDELDIQTWVSDVRRASAIRHYRITRVRDGALVARIRSLYAWVDLSAGRPVRIPPDFLADFGPNIVA